MPGCPTWAPSGHRVFVFAARVGYHNTQLLCHPLRREIGGRRDPFGGRRGFQPPHNTNRINAGFSPGGTLSANFTRNPEFFPQPLLTPAESALKSSHLETSDMPTYWYQEVPAPGQGKVREKVQAPIERRTLRLPLGYNNRTILGACALSPSSSDGAMKPPSLPEIQILLGPFSLSSVQMWLRLQKLTYSASTRGEIAKRVHDAIKKGHLTFQDVVDGLIGIEESRSKTVHLVCVKDAKHLAQKVDKQLTDLGTKLSSSRSLATVQSPTPKMIYAVNTHKEFRMKWGEVQTRATFDRKNLDVKKESIPVIFVFVLDKATGLGQLRYEPPEMVHSHLINGAPTKQAYLNFYREKCENMTDRKSV